MHISSGWLLKSCCISRRAVSYLINEHRGVTSDLKREPINTVRWLLNIDPYIYNNNNHEDTPSWKRQLCKTEYADSSNMSVDNEDFRYPEREGSVWVLFGHCSMLNHMWNSSHFLSNTSQIDTHFNLMSRLMAFFCYGGSIIGNHEYVCTRKMLGVHSFTFLENNLYWSMTSTSINKHTLGSSS